MMQTQRFQSFCAVTIALSITVACSAVGGAQAPPRNLSEWELEYTISGGLAFSAHALTVTRAGEVKASDTRLGDDVAGRASNDLVTAISAFLKAASEAKKTVPMPDAMAASLVLTSGGRKYELEPTRDVEAKLDAAWDAAVSGALVGSWRQSGWKLCNPAAQLASSDMDTPIDDLTFRADGTFGLMWVGGGAHTTGIPHIEVPYPDDTGEYALTPSTGAIRLRATNPLVTRRDFAGEGRFRISGTELTLTHIWFGTRAAPQKPDICELTFLRK